MVGGPGPPPKPHGTGPSLISVPWQRPGHQSQPQAWLQSGVPVHPYLTHLHGDHMTQQGHNGPHRPSFEDLCRAVIGPGPWFYPFSALPTSLFAFLLIPGLCCAQIGASRWAQGCCPGSCGWKCESPGMDQNV